MPNTTPMPALSALGVAALVLSACGGGASAADEPEPITSASEELEGNTATPDDAGYVPLTADHLADGLEMTDCVAAQDNILVPPDYLIEDEAHLEAMCPDSAAIGRVGDGTQQIVLGPDGVEIMDAGPDESGQAEGYHLYCEDEDALAEKAAHNGDSQPVGWPQEWDGTGAMPDPLCHPDYLEIAEWEHLAAHYACWEGIETSTFLLSGQPEAQANALLWEQSQARADWAPNPPGGTCAEQWAEHEGGDPEDYADIDNANDG